jgi:flagellum-specific peptidoglycan hydrolase FlgJ
MATLEQLQFLQKEAGAAATASHLWPEFAACEAAVETAWGTSRLYLQGCNIFGEKQHEQPIFKTVTLPTREMEAGQWITVDAAFIWFPTTIESFVSRMKTLRRLAATYPEYAAALAATSGEDFVTQVSKRWSTDPQRAVKVLEIYSAHRNVFVQQGGTQ